MGVGFKRLKNESAEDADFPDFPGFPSAWVGKSADESIDEGLPGANKKAARNRAAWKGETNAYLRRRLRNNSPAPNKPSAPVVGSEMYTTTLSYKPNNRSLPAASVVVALMSY